MKLKEEETKQEKQDRLTIVDKNRNEFITKAIPVLVIILIVMLSMLVVLVKKENEKNVGNPYECMDCKELARACRRHKKFNSDEELKKKISNGLYQYKHYADTQDETEYIYYLYGESYYNLDCDFCKENYTECDGCAYTRKSISEYIKQELTDEKIDRLCSECKEKGYPYCNSDLTYVTDSIYEQIKGN